MTKYNQVYILCRQTLGVLIYVVIEDSFILRCLTLCVIKQLISGMIESIQCK